MPVYVSKFGENHHGLAERDISVEVEHVKSTPHEEGKDKYVAF